jgi:signal transduction histidine kinase/ligand-binding sensor domain-containing protein
VFETLNGGSYGHIIETRAAVFAGLWVQPMNRLLWACQSLMGRNRCKSLRVVGYLLALPLALCLVLSSLYAQDQTVAQMVHTAWTGRDGAPQGITALAQTPDGTLWIGAIGGLFTFDGVKFDAFRPKAGSPPLPDRAIRFLFVSKSGELWASPFHGPAIWVHAGEAETYGRADGDHLDVIGQVQQDSSGVFWSVLNEKHLVRLGSDGVWHQAVNPLVKTGHVSKLFIDSNDTQWVIEDNLLYRRPQGETEFSATGIHVYGPAKITESQDHSLWVIGQGPVPAGAANLQHIDRLGQRLSAPQVRGQMNTILVAPDNSLWVNINEQLQRFDAAAISRSHSDARRNDSDLYTLKNGPTEFGLQALFGDADGNIWLGGMGGLDRFERATLVSAVPDAKVGEWHSCVDTQGNVWIADDAHLFEIKDRHLSLMHGWKGISNLACGREKRVYVFDDSGISVVSTRRTRHFPLLPGFSGYGDHYLFLGLLEQADGDIVASVGGAVGHGLWKYRAGGWTRFLADLALPEVGAMFQDANGSLYLIFTNDRSVIARIRNGSVEKLPVAIEPFGFGQTSYGLFAYGRSGIAIVKDGSFQSLSFQLPERAKLITGLVESRSGDLWINTARGIVRIPATEVRSAAADRGHAISSVEYREGDLVGPDITTMFRNSVQTDPSGRLWFSTLNGVVSVDPDHLVVPPHPPLLSIRSLLADGREIDANATFPADTHTLTVGYFGLDLTDPRRVVYRIRLEGVGLDPQDSSWQEVGSRTEATYTHLRPGSYRFQVMASNSNNIWTQPVSSATFRILPHFYERSWVEALFVLAGLFLVWIGISLRLRYMSAAIRIRAEERADERVRIARELHDTLLQGVQGLLLNFHVAAEKVPSDHVSKKALEKALSTADRIIVEGRNRVSRLRAENLNDAELKSLIEGVAANFNAVHAIDFAVERKGRSNSLRSHVVDEIFCIAREALTNAFRHSGASRIVIELDYQEREFKMSCRDNGRGFDAEAFFVVRSNGHWGLRGMEERAKGIGAKLSLTSAADKGTEVRIIMPARLAYVRNRRLDNFLRRRPVA